MSGSVLLIADYSRFPTKVLCAYSVYNTIECVFQGQLNYKKTRLSF